MGADGPGLFSDDTACDVRDAYRDALADGLEDAEAERAVLAAGGDLDRWREAGAAAVRRRAAVLARVREQLVGPQPPRRPIRRRSTAVFDNSGKAAGRLRRAALGRVAWGLRAGVGGCLS